MKKLTVFKAKELGESFARAWTPLATEKQIEALTELGEVLTIAIPDAYSKLDWVFFRVHPESDGDREGSELFWGKLYIEADCTEELDVPAQILPVDSDFVQSFIDTAIELYRAAVAK